MTGEVDMSWDGAEFTAERLADALECTQRAAEELISSSASPRGRRKGIQKVALAVAWALHRDAGLQLPVAAAIARSRPRLCESVLTTLDFFPPSSGDEGSTECDPFMFFAPHASESKAVPAIDEFIDLSDNRRICWRRPRRDAYRLACELRRLSEAVKSDDTPALHEAYLDLLSGLRGPVPQVSEWIGTVREGVFRPVPDRFAEPSPAMRPGLEIEPDPSRFENTYGTRVSVNISLAARCFKRRMLGLEVTDPFVGGSPAWNGNEGASVL